MEEYSFVLTDTINKEYRDSIDSKLTEFNIAQSDYFLEVRKPERGKKPLDLYVGTKPVLPTAVVFVNYSLRTAAGFSRPATLSIAPSAALEPARISRSAPPR